MGDKTAIEWTDATAKRCAGPCRRDLPRSAFALDSSGNYRHEYDHARGYNGDNQLFVEPVCSKCHHNREDARHG